MGDAHRVRLSAVLDRAALELAVSPHVGELATCAERDLSWTRCHEVLDEDDNPITATAILISVMTCS